MTASFNDILGGADFTQHVTGATHRAGHTWNVLITQSDAIVSVKLDEFGAISDHSLIIANIVPEHPILLASATITSRQWVKFDEVEFHKVGFNNESA